MQQQPKLRVRHVAKLTGLSKPAIYAAVRRRELRARQYRGYKGRKESIVIEASDYERWIRDYFTDIC